MSEDREDNVIPFRRKPRPIVWSDGRIQHGCDEMVHVYAEVPGFCECGESWWDGLTPDDAKDSEK